jgi:hypothetical protein
MEERKKGVDTLQDIFLQKQNPFFPSPNPPFLPARPAFLF